MWRHTRTYRGVRRMSQEAITLATDRKSTRLNSSHSQISYAVFCLKKKKTLTYHHDESTDSHRSALNSSVAGSYPSTACSALGHHRCRVHLPLHFPPQAHEDLHQAR